MIKDILNTKHKKCLAVAIVATMIMSSFAFCMSSISNEAQIPNEIMPTAAPMVIDATEEEYASFVTMLEEGGMSLAAIEEGVTFADGEMSITLAMIGFAIGLVIGLAVGMYFGILIGSNNNSNPPPGDTEGVRAQLRELMSVDIHNTYNAALGMFERLLLNDVNILRFTQQYWNLQIDTIVNKTYMPNSYPANLDEIVDDAGVLLNLSIIKQNMNQSLNMFSYDTRQMTWTMPGSDPTTYGSKIQAGWTFGSYEWFADGSNVYMTLGDYVYATPTSYKVYIDIVTDSAVIAKLPDVNAMWTTASSSITLTSSDSPTTTYTLAPGKNDLGPTGLNIAPGFYNLAPNVGYVSSNLLPSISAVGVIPTTGFTLTNGSQYALGHQYGNDYRITYQGISNTYSDISFAVRWQDSIGGWETLKSVDGSGRSLVMGALDAYSAIWNTYESIFIGPNGCRNAIQVTWNVLDALEAQSGSYVIRPSAILGGINQNLHLPISVQTAVVLASMRQLISSGYTTDPSQIFISRESLGQNGTVYVYGNIYSNGILIAKNAVFTPLYYGANETMTAGTRVLLTDQPTVLISTYATDVPSMAAFVPNPAVFNVTETEGATTEIEVFEIWVGYEQVPYYKFEIFEAQLLGVYDFGFTHRPGGQVNPSNESFWMGLAVFFAGLSVLLAGILLGMNPILIVIGGAIMFLGFGQITFGLIDMILDFFNKVWDFISGPFGYMGGGP